MNKEHFSYIQYFIDLLPENGRQGFIVLFCSITSIIVNVWITFALLALLSSSSWMILPISITSLIFGIISFVMAVIGITELL